MMTMPESLNFILTRAIATRNAQESVKDKWVWEEKMVAQWDADVAAARAQQEAVSQQETEMLAQRSALDVALEELHRQTMQGVAMAKVRYRGDAAKRALVKGLSAKGGSRNAILKEALAWESAWEKTDATWSPTVENTFAEFEFLRKQCQTLQANASQSRANWRAAAEELNERAEKLEDANVAWYASATVIFAAGTPEGDMIRGTVPTTYTRPTPPALPRDVSEEEDEEQAVLAGAEKAWGVKRNA
jgi:hypothetical protein